MRDEDEGDRDREAIPARGRDPLESQTENLRLLVEAIAEMTFQNSYQLRQTMQAVERLARLMEEMRRDGAGKCRG
ncbi:MAG: hypothetical protein HC833_05815 [Leptolyngbyaceae cyanobacterium RM1_406_9]|nr:hypothetical protein [Leptolyngbyaceae cyanobacterium RM1_406_9]